MHRSRPMEVPRTRRHYLKLSLTLRQMLNLVIVGAVASWSVAPIVRLKLVGAAPTWAVVFLWGAIAVPLVSAIVAFPLVRKGPLKDWLVRVLLLASVTSALVFAICL